MKSIAFLRLILALLCLPALAVRAQTVPANPPAGFEALPASSPYGAAFVKTNIPYADHPTARQNFDLYIPQEKGGQPLPLVVWIHGGAWLSGFKDWDNVKYLVRHGYALASIDYRFTPEAAFPAQIQDCNTALNFILAHAGDYGLDARRFVVGGGSAGGHLALLLGMAREAKDFGADPTVKPLGILDFFGPTDFTLAKDDLQKIHSQRGLDLLESAGTKLLGVPFEDSTATAKQTASPLSYVDASNPPVLILQGGKDDLVAPAQSERLQAALKQAGVKTGLVELPDAGHDGPLFSTPEVQGKVIGFLNGVMSDAGGR